MPAAVLNPVEMKGLIDLIAGIGFKSESYSRFACPAKWLQPASLAKENTPTRVIGLKMGRTEGSIQSKASAEKI